ncbi:MAG: hypothetical protein AAFZ09_03455 [Pseudomonadota bacterium]
MGPCQGRQCALTVQALIARAGHPPAEAGPLRFRPPVVPIPLEALADMEIEGDG